jgi:hypothetical protein
MSKIKIWQNEDGSWTGTNEIGITITAESEEIVRKKLWNAATYGWEFDH